MTKTYFNDAVIREIKMLACLTGSGELVRLFWPHIDYPQHVEKWQQEYFILVRKTALRGLMSTIGNTLSIVEDTNILKTLCENESRGLKSSRQIMY